jgi:hypothetical protein
MGRAAGWPGHRATPVGGGRGGAKLRRLYDAIEAGIADLADPMLKDRIAELTTIRDQAREPPRFSRRPFGLSYAAIFMDSCCTAARI